MTVIAIDGPSGTGKSTAARRLAEKLGFTYYDTGAMYRTITWLALEMKCDLSDSVQLDALITAFDFHIEQEGLERRYLVGSEDVTDAIRTPEVTEAVSEVSAYQQVRHALVAVQRATGKRGNIVVEGRDIGTVVFPDASFKFFLTARPEVRAARRLGERKEASLEEILADQKRRDAHDSTREHSPLRPADDAIEIDTSDLTLKQVVNILYKEVKKR